jgi:hypothetical protein
MKAPYVEKLDSSAAQTRALAAALHGRHFDPFNLSFAARSAMRFYSLVTDELIGLGVTLASGFIGLPGHVAERVRTAHMAEDVGALYQDRPYRSILLGAPNGGVSHLGAIMDAPFLTSHFLLCFRHLKNADDVYSCARVGRRLAQRITRNNGDVQAIIHFDPVHDRPVVIFITHIRLKLMQVPDAYGAFIKRNLAPGGALVLIDCGYPWLQYRMRRRISFQVGGLGGIPDSEFLVGSDDVDNYLKEQKSPLRDGWRIKHAQHRLGIGPESEWGAMPEFNQDVARFAGRNRIRLVTLFAEHPADFSRLSFEMHREASRRDGCEPMYLFADCFSQVDPVFNLNSRVLPLWLPYYDARSFDLAKDILGSVSRDTQCLLTLHPSFAKPFDMIPLEQWVNLFTLGAPPLLVGVDPDRYPLDMSYTYDFVTQLKRFGKIHKDPVRARLDADDLVRVAQKAGLRVRDTGL